MSQLHVLGGTYGSTLDARGHDIGEPGLANPHNIFDPESRYTRELANATAAYVRAQLAVPDVPLTVGLNVWRSRDVRYQNVLDLCALHRTVQRSAIGAVLGSAHGVTDFRGQQHLAESVPLYLSFGPLATDAYSPVSTAVIDIEFQRQRLHAAAQLGVRAVFETIGSLEEAQTVIAAADTLEDSDLPPPEYFISFVLQQAGTLIDGTPLHEAINQLDERAANGRDFAPGGYGLNCCSIKSINAALLNNENRRALERVGLVYPNAAGELCDTPHALESHSLAGHLVRDGVSNESIQYLVNLGLNVIGDRSTFKAVGFCCGGLPEDNRTIAEAINSRL